MLSRSATITGVIAAADLKASPRSGVTTDLAKASLSFGMSRIPPVDGCAGKASAVSRRASSPDCCATGTRSE
ncbi:hypothetical protein GCM10022245_34660 [Streptomyces mayteni]